MYFPILWVCYSKWNMVTSNVEYFVICYDYETGTGNMKHEYHLVTSVNVVHTDVIIIKCILVHVPLLFHPHDGSP